MNAVTCAPRAENCKRWSIHSTPFHVHDAGYRVSLSERALTLQRVHVAYLDAYLNSELWRESPSV